MQDKFNTPDSKSSLDEDSWSNKSSNFNLLSLFKQKRLFAILLLGFSSGLPLFLVYPTLSLWLRDLELQRSSIGFFSWVTLSYSFKFLWAPLFDSIKIPFLAKILGRDRAWILVCQILVTLGLVLIGYFGVTGNFVLMAFAAAFTAFASASQDVAVDGWRIRITPDEKQHGVMTSLYQYGYHASRLISGVGALYIAEYLNWSTAYIIMALFMIVGIIGMLIAPNTDNSFTKIIIDKSKDFTTRTVSFLKRMIFSPFIDFIQRFKLWGIYLLIFIAVYRLPDGTLTLANVFYADLGYSKTQIADVTKIFGLFFSLFGVFLTGISIFKIGIYKTLFIGGIIQAVSNLCYVWLFYQEPIYINLFFNHPTDLNFIITLLFENISGGFAGTALIAFMSSLTNIKFSATQYALFSSFYAIPGKLLGGFGGLIVDKFGYVIYFTTTAILGLVGISMIGYLIFKKIKI